MQNKKITFITASDETAGSTRIRVYKIANELKSRGYDVSINENIKNADILIFQKSSYKAMKKKFRKALLSNKFIVFDIDDLYSDGHIKFVKYSDLVIASCDYLKQQYLKYNKNIKVLDGTLDVINKDIPMPVYNLKNPKIGWFGTVSNLHLIEKFGIKNVTTITMGGDIEWSRETVDYNIQKFDLIVIPQEKTPVGLSKSNCRILKTLYLGVPALVSDIPEYIKLAELVDYPKEMLVKDNEDWNEKIEKIKSGEIKFDFDFDRCRKILIENYDIKPMTDKWLDIIKSSYKKDNFINHLKSILLKFKMP